MGNNNKLEKEAFIANYKSLNLNLDVRFDPFPKYVEMDDISLLFKRGEMSATITLMNGLLCRVPFNNCDKCALIMNTNLFYSSGKSNWNKLFRHLGIKEGKNNVTRYTPTDNYVIYDEKYDSEVEFIFRYYNYRLNEDRPFEYPSNWFDVIRLLIPRSGGPVGISGKQMVIYMLAAPRHYLYYFVKGKTNKEIADTIFYDNL